MASVNLSLKLASACPLRENTIHVIMQEKIKLYLAYVEHASFWYDLKLIFQAFKVIVTE